MTNEEYAQQITNRLDQIRRLQDALQRERQVLIPIRTRVRTGAHVQEAEVEIARYGYTLDPVAEIDRLFLTAP